MPEAVQLHVVDAFAGAPFAGNPAGVVLDADELDENQMRAIAREVNASETAFLSRTNDLHRPARLRWFTPTVEVDFCGHATLAAAHAWAEVFGIERLLAGPEARIEFETAAGTLRLRAERADAEAEGTIWWLDMPTPTLKPDNTNPFRLCELLGITPEDLDPASPIVRSGDDDVILLVKTWRRLSEMRPNFFELGEWSERHRIRGFCVATTDSLNRTTHVHSRFFAPAAGIPEDPVTGSIHGPLCLLLVSKGLVPMTGPRAALNCLQGCPGGRSGLVRALVDLRGESYSVTIGGACHTTIRGRVQTPPKQ